MKLVCCYHKVFHKFTPAFRTDAASSDEFDDAMSQYVKAKDTRSLDCNKIEILDIQADDYPEVPFFSAY